MPDSTFPSSLSSSSLNDTGTSSKSKPTPKSAATLSRQQAHDFRRIGHQLTPIVTIGAQGASETVVEEIRRALSDHELIKIKIPAGTKAERMTLLELICHNTQSTLIQQVGRMALLYRPNPEANPKLSNLHRYAI